MSRRGEDTGEFYDRVVQCQAEYGLDILARLRPQLDGFDAEARFTELAQQYVGADDVVVDIGTGDGDWLMTSVAPRASRAIGFDTSRRRLCLALQKRNSEGVCNTEFLLADGRRIPIRDGAATVVVSRRGPWTHDEAFFAEGCRVLAPGGVGLEIAIGEQNAREIEAVFGEREQMHAWRARGLNRLEALGDLYRRHGLEPLIAESHVATEVFPSREALIYRLQSAPIVVDFDAGADAPRVDEVVARHGGPDGIRITIHRLCLVTRKTA